MEFVPGQHLKRLIQQQTRLPVDDTVKLMIQACAGIGYAHRAGIVHCDIKPHNMVVTPDMHLKVTDFGIARALASIHPEEQAEIVWGSPQYFSPEQAAGAAPSPASDVYSLGVVMYELLTGALPYQASTSEELARLHQNANPIAPRTLNPEIPPELEKIVLKVLAKEPAARYRTADQLGHILEALMNGAGPNSIQEPNSRSETAQPVPQAGRSAVPFKHVEAYPVSRPKTPPNLMVPKNPNLTDIDWATIFLWLLAVILVGGLIPFWLWVILRFNAGP
jgi:serine/threonine-protein kinase